ncbi:MATE family efflux transporter [Acetohalobium arabaticum]|uniref:Probable multidrug resistance protein NorM n=1 Tax=Acetohalobium arabaticum (strain ATCC 49924 / DSM 5501 / Z-7288) TaxID=574087 RepID=D9QSG0_ACEAZ|nr:MATE family efflux transporter [Acetohalobium arabaticum]ADL13423.1 MATE efflux family protein [Acetohalobium arabaticum DSM 5501]
MELTEKADRLGTEAIIPLLIKLSIPSIIGMGVQALYNIVDSIYVGRLSTEALSALSLAFPIQLILVALGVGTGVGTSSLISRLLGKSEGARANNAAEHVILISLGYGLIIGLIGFFFADDLIHLFTTDTLLIDLGQRYIRIIMVGSLAIFIPMIFNNILRGEGNTFLPMLTMLIGAGLNIILDPFLIFGIGIFPQLGVDGAAYATVFSRLVSGIFITAVLFSDQNQIQLRFSEFKFDFQIIKEIYQVGFPAMIMRLLASIMVLGMNKIVGNYSTTAIAVVGIFFRLQTFVLLPVFGFNQGFLPIVGYNYGHNNPKRMKKTITYGMLSAFCFTLLGFLIFRLFPGYLIKLFNQDPKLISMGTTALKKISFAYLLAGINIVGSATFQALGDGLPSLCISFLRQIILILPLMYLLGEFYGLNTVWFAIPIAEVFSFLLLTVWLMSTLKKAFSNMKEQNFV